LALGEWAGLKEPGPLLSFSPTHPPLGCAGANGGAWGTAFTFIAKLGVGFLLTSPHAKRSIVIIFRTSKPLAISPAGSQRLIPARDSHYTERVCPAVTGFGPEPTTAPIRDSQSEQGVISLPGHAIQRGTSPNLSWILLAHQSFQLITLPPFRASSAQKTMAWLRMTSSRVQPTRSLCALSVPQP